MTRAQGLSDFAAGLGDTLKIDADNGRVGINSTAPTEALDVDGNLKVSGSITGASFTGIDVTSLKDTTGGSVKVQANASGAVVTGILTATSFSGDGSALTGVSGFATALSNDSTNILNKVFKTPFNLEIASDTTVNSDAASDFHAFVREGRLHVQSGQVFTVGSGTTFVMNVLGIFP